MVEKTRIADDVVESPLVNTDEASINGPLDAESATVESLVVGGALYDEDPNSPINENISGSSYTFNLADPSREVIIVPDRGVPRFGNTADQLRTNGVDTGDEYTTIFNDGTSVSNNNQWQLNDALQRFNHIYIYDVRGVDDHCIGTVGGRNVTDFAVGGSHGQGNDTINSIEFIRGSGDLNDLQCRVYRRVMDI